MCLVGRNVCHLRFPIPRARIQRRVPRRSFTLASDLGASRGRCNLQDPDFLVWFNPLACGGLKLCSCRLQTANCRLPPPAARCAARAHCAASASLQRANAIRLSHCPPLTKRRIPRGAPRRPVPVAACPRLTADASHLMTQGFADGEGAASEPAETEKSRLRHRMGHYRLQKLTTSFVAMSLRIPSSGPRRAGSLVCWAS